MRVFNESCSGRSGEGNFGRIGMGVLQRNTALATFGGVKDEERELA